MCETEGSRRHRQYRRPLNCRSSLFFFFSFLSYRLLRLYHFLIWRLHLPPTAAYKINRCRKMCRSRKYGYLSVLPASAARPAALIRYYCYYIYIFFCLFRSVCWGADAKKGVVARFLGTVLRRHSRSSIFFFLPHFLACFSFHYKYIFSLLLLLLLPQPLNLLGREDEDATAGVPLYSSIGRHSQTWSEFRVLAERFFSCPRWRWRIFFICI